MLFKRNCLWPLVATLGLTACSEPTPTPNTKTETETTTEQRLAQFNGDKFGMFIHWGLYAVPAGVYNDVPLRGLSAWIQHTMDVPLEEYRQYAKGMTLDNYQPQEWAELAKNAGMKYMVITAKHHDGFAMYDSKVSEYDMVNTPYGKDPLVPLADAARAQGIDFGFYYSQDQDWEDPNARGNELEFDPEKADPAIYLEKKALPQIDELVQNYGDISFLWFDTPGALSKEQASTLRERVKQAQPNALLNARIGHNLGDFAQTGDNAIPLQVWDDEGKWETPATINHSWGYHAFDNHWREPRDLTGKLVDIVSKGGNYLLNIGPRPDGSIPKPSVDILLEMGDWLARNGDSIYGTEHCPFYFDQIDWRCTTKGNKLYLHVYNWKPGTFTLEGLSSKVSSAKLLDGGKAVSFEQQSSLTLDLPVAANRDEINVIELTVEGDSVEVAEGFEHTVRPDTIELYALNARFRGQDIHYDWNDNSASNFLDISKEKGYNEKKLTYRNELWWYPYGTINGTYKASVTLSCSGDDAGEIALKTQNTDSDDKVLENVAISQAVQCNAGEMQTVNFDDVMITNKETLRQLVFGINKYGKDSDTIHVHKVTLTKQS